MGKIEYKLALLKSLNLFSNIVPKHFEGPIHRFYAEEKSSLMQLHIVMVNLSILRTEQQVKIVRYFEYLFSEQQKTHHLAPLVRILYKEKFLILVYKQIDGVSLFHLVTREQGLFPSHVFTELLNGLTELYDECHRLGFFLSESNLENMKYDVDGQIILQEWGLGILFEMEHGFTEQAKEILSPINRIVSGDTKEEIENRTILFILLFLFEGPYIATRLSATKAENVEKELEGCRNVNPLIKEWFRQAFWFCGKFYKGSQFRKLWKKINRKNLTFLQKTAIAAVILLAMCVWGFMDYYKQFGKLYISGLPPKADIYFNNNKKNINNDEWIRLKAGVYHIRCEADGYSSFSDTLEVHEGIQDSLRIMMYPGAYLNFDVFPEEAMIQIDSKVPEKAEIANGKTYFVPAGNHAIRLSFSPYINLIDSIRLDKFERLHYKKDLSQFTGILKIISPSEEGKIFVEMDLKNLDIRKADAGYESQLIRIELPFEKWHYHPLRIGHHRLIYQHPGYDDIVKEFNIIAGKKTKIKLKFPDKKHSKKMKRLKENFLGKTTGEEKIPSGRLVVNSGFKWHYLKGLGKQYEQERKFISKVNNIPPGSYKITIANPHFEDFILTVQINENQSDSLVIDLSRRSYKHFIKSAPDKNYREIIK